MLRPAIKAWTWLIDWLIDLLVDYFSNAVNRKSLTKESERMNGSHSWLWLVDWSVHWLIDWLVGSGCFSEPIRLMDWLFDQLVDLIHWLIDWVDNGLVHSGRLIDWLIGGFAYDYRTLENLPVARSGSKNCQEKNRIIISAEQEINSSNKTPYVGVKPPPS